MDAIVGTPQPPYYAVIFTSVLSSDDKEYSNTSLRMEALASEQDGFLGLESARDSLGVTVSYWRDLESIKAWKDNLEHAAAQSLGKERWYRDYKVRVSRVERDYGLL